MLRQAENKVKIEGILSEIDLKTGSFKKKDGSTVDSIGGTIKVKVQQKIGDKECTLEIPVHMFASKMTNAGKPNPAYESISRVMNEYTSIAAAGSEDGADRIRITSGQIQMNEYYSPNGQLISFPRINSSFVTKVKKEEFSPEATFIADFFVASKEDEVDVNDVATGRIKIRGILPQYGGKVDVVDFYGMPGTVKDSISKYWNEGDTVKAQGRLNFSSKTEKIVREVDFGEPQVDIRTINVSELIITGGNQTPVDGEFAFDPDEIQQALMERKARLDAQKDKDMERAKNRGTKAPEKSAIKDSLDVGF